MASISTPSLATLKFLRRALKTRPVSSRLCHPFPRPFRNFHASPAWFAIRSHKLSDVGEGTKEVQIIQWFVEEGARVEEWAKLCEVQSDKAAVDITSRYAGLIKKLHFKKDDIVQVGDVMVDFEVDEVDDEEPSETDNQDREAEDPTAEEDADEDTPAAQEVVPEQTEKLLAERMKPGRHASLATPAVRGLLKQHDVSVEDVEGTGKDGRVLKEDVHRFISQLDLQTTQQRAAMAKPIVDSKQVETPQRLSPVQSAMLKAMTVSLSIPHFLYSDSVNISQLSGVRSRLNASRNAETTPKLSYLPFAVKAVSLALNKYPLLNARLDTTDPKKPQLLMRSSHNIGIAMDTPGGLLVPVIKNVNARSVLSIAEELQRLSQLGQAGKLSNADLSGSTITVSNIGSIGGEVVAPVIVEGQLAIMGMGKVKAVPVFGQDGKSIERAEMMGVSWSADHRVVDGATMARMAKVVQSYLEEPGSMIVEMT